jgi:hypothetical protein
MIAAPLLGIAVALVPTAQVLAPPSPVVATDQLRHLVYEMPVHNGTASRVRLDRVEVAASRGRVLVTYRGAAIAGLMTTVERVDRPTRSLGPHRDGMLFMDVPLPQRRPIPARLVHRLRFTRASGPAPRTVTVTGAPTVVDRRAPIALAPPLHADRIVAVDAHARAVLSTGRRLWFSQRYALDLVRLNEQRNGTFVGDPTRNESYAVYGAQVTAAGPGRVIATRNDLPENTPVGTRPQPVTPDNIAGNFVVQSLPGGRYALYAHFQPGTVAVAPGDTVQAGQPLGVVGNTGNSSEPHLHFHVADRPEVLAANGRPYVFDAFGLDGRIEGLERGAFTFAPAAPRDRTAELPLHGDVMTFP